MGRRITRGFCGYCPELDEQMEVQVTFAEIRAVCMMTPGYKKVSLFCPHAADNGCEIGNDCPIFKSAVNP